jgi:hypothetical protein
MLNRRSRVSTAQDRGGSLEDVMSIVCSPAAADML